MKRLCSCSPSLSLLCQLANLLHGLEYPTICALLRNCIPDCSSLLLSRLFCIVRENIMFCLVCRLALRLGCGKLFVGSIRVFDYTIGLSFITLSSATSSVSDQVPLLVNSSEFIFILITAKKWLKIFFLLTELEINTLKIVKKWGIFQYNSASMPLLFLSEGRPYH